jgi:hypothetical protein
MPCSYAWTFRATSRFLFERVALTKLLQLLACLWVKLSQNCYKFSLAGVVMEDSGEHSKVPGWLRTVVIGRNPKLTMVRVLILALAAVLVPKFILLPIRVQGASMWPAYKENGVNFVNRLAYRWSEPKRGDVVAIRLAGDHVL